jgi:tRNA pseudouridine55 synthase
VDKTLQKLIILNKKEGETPLEALEKFRRKNKKYKDIKMTYAGRLDPMASGVLLVLAGVEIKNKEKYLKLDKEYEFEILFGFATDTYDILGKVTHLRHGVNVYDEEIKNNLQYFKGKIKQKYPLYSSKNIKRVLAGEEIEHSSREVEIKSLRLFKLRKINNKKLLANIKKRIKKVNGDFRQKEILKLWRKKLSTDTAAFNIASFKIACSSGTYVRGIANALGEKLGIPALAFSIKRTKVGKFGKIGK